MGNNKLKDEIVLWSEFLILPVTSSLGTSSTAGFDVLNAAVEDCADTIINMGNATSMLPVSTNNSSCNIELTLFQSSGSTENFSATSQQSTTVGSLTLSCSTSADLEEPWIEIFILKKDNGTLNAVACDKIEANAKKIYDLLDKNHDITLDGNSSMIVLDEKTAIIVDQFIKGKSKEDLLSDLMAMKEAIASEGNQKKLK